MSLCKKDVTPLLLTHWIYVFLALTHRYNTFLASRQIMQTDYACVMCVSIGPISSRITPLALTKSCDCPNPWDWHLKYRKQWVTWHKGLIISHKETKQEINVCLFIHRIYNVWRWVICRRKIVIDHPFLWFILYCNFSYSSVSCSGCCQYCIEYCTGQFSQEKT